MPPQHADSLAPLTAYDLLAFFEERLAAVQRHPPAEMHLNTGPPTIAAVRDAVKATLAHARARGFA